MSKKILLSIIVLVIVTSAIYAFNLHNKLFWDDNDWIVNNPFVHNFSIENIKLLFTRNTLAGIGEKSNYYRPILFLSFALNYVIAGIKPLGYHLINNGLHLINVILIYLLLLKIFHNQRLAFIASLLFAIHPLQTEAVTYISGRGDPLSVLFILLMLWLFLHYRNKRSWLALTCSLILFVLAILTREVAIITPLLIVALVVSLESGRFWRNLWQGIKASLPYDVVAAIYVVLRLTVFNFKNTLNFYLQDNIYTQHLLIRIFTFFHALFDYISLIFVPRHLHMERSVPLHTSLFQWPVWLTALALVALVCGLVYLYRRERANHALYEMSLFRVWFFSWSFFFIWLIPSSGIIPVNALLYEHWLYLSLFGFFTLLAFYIDKLLLVIEKQKDIIMQMIVVALLMIYGFWLGYIAIQRNKLWGNAVAFYRNVLRYEPDSVRIHNNLGNTYFDLGDKENAEKEYWEAVKTEDIFPQPHFNLASILAERGDIAGAIIELEKSIKIEPDFHYAYQSLSVLYAKQGNITKASDYAQKLVQLRPSDPRVYYNYALVLLVQKNQAKALEISKQGLVYAERDQIARDALTDLVHRLAPKR